MTIRLAVTAAFLSIASLVSAGAVSDYLVTADGQPNQANFGFGDVPPIPADFFGPGSDPFVGSVSWTGVPLDAGSTEGASVRAQRGGDPVQPTDPPLTVGTVPIEIVQLSLVSTDPITVTYNGGQNPQAWEVVVGLSEVPIPPGQLTATKTHDNGGFFNADFFVQPVFTFVQVDDLDQVRVLDTGLEGLKPNHLVVIGAPFVHSADPALEILPPTGGSQWVPGITQPIPGNPASQVPTSFTGTSDGGGVDHSVIVTTPKEGRCELLGKTIPSNQTACTTTTTNGKKDVRVYFGMDAMFRSNCACCEYRQNVKGEFKYDGAKVPHEMNTGVFLDKNTFKEDGFGLPTPAGSNKNYGHRGDANNPAHDRYSNPAARGAGCDYNGTDAPGLSGMTAGKAYSIDLSFEGKIIDTCNGTVVQTNTWTVNCAGTALGPAPDPLVEVLTPTTIDGRAAVLGVYVYPGDILTVIGSLHNGFGEVPIDASEVDIDVPALLLVDVPDGGVLPESELPAALAHAIYDFDYPPGSPADLTIDFTYGNETQQIDVSLPGPPCPWDCQAAPDGNIGINDFLELLGQWSQIGSSCDFDGTGVGINAFLDLLANWGPCP